MKEWTHLHRGFGVGVGGNTCQAKGSRRLGIERVQRAPQDLSGHSKALPAAVPFITGTERGK